MRASKLFIGLFLSAGLAGVAFAEDAEEGPREACIEIPCFDMSGRVKEFNGTWKEGQDMQEKLIKMETDLAEVEPSLRAAMGVADDAPIDKAFEDMKTTAGDKLVVTLEGGKTSFSAADDAPENVKAFADAANEASNRLEKIAADAASMESDITRLGQEASEATGQVNKDTMKNNGLKISDLKGELDIVKHNKTAAAGLKDRAAKVAAESTRLSNLMASMV